MIHRGIVVTHGVGSQRRLDQLDDVVEPMMTFLCRALGYEHVHLVARTLVGDGEGASAVIRLTPPGATPEEWHVREAWWAESFRSSPSTTVLSWAVGAAFFHLRSTWLHVFWRNARRVAGHAPPPPPQDGVWSAVGAGKIRAFSDATVWLVITLGYLVVYLFGSIIIAPLYVFLLLPIGALWPAGIGTLQRRLVNVLTGGIGDQHATTNRQLAVSGAADTIVQALGAFLDPERAGEHSYDTVTLVAHSGGCVVSLDALARGDVQQWLNAPGRPRRVTWITVGSGLNLAWRMRARAKARDAVFWGRRLDQSVNWIDIYARYDPVPQGPAPVGLVEGIVGEEPRPYVSIRVANHDWPLTDHGAYWGNMEEVMSRIVYAVADSRLGRLPLDPWDGSPAQETALDGSCRPHPLASAIEEQTGQAGSRRTRVTTHRMGSIALIAAGALLIFGWGPSLGAWALGQEQHLILLPGLPGDWSPTLQWLVPGHVGPIPLGTWRSWIAGVLVLALLLYSIAILAQLVNHWWSWRKPEATGGAPNAAPRGGDGLAGNLASSPEPGIS